MRSWYFLILAAALPLFGAGCQFIPLLSWTTSAPNSPEVDTDTVQERKQTPPDPISVANLAKGWIPHNPFSASGTIPISASVGNDCASIQDGYSQGGDLLRTLAEDPSIQPFWHPQILTSAHLEGLYRRITTLPENTGDDIYAFYVCSLGKDLDLVAAIPWPKDKQTWTPDDTGYITSVRDFDMSTNPLIATGTAAVLYAVTPDKVSSFTHQPLMNSTLTGGDTDACEATRISTTQFTWRCMMGWAGEPGSGKLTYRTTTFSVATGKTVKTVNTVEIAR
jgi:hypothetical protein